jgi:hypothetical protein
MAQGDDTTNLARMFGAKNDQDTQDDDDGPSEDDVKKAKSDAFDVFWDAMHAKDKDKARKAWDAMHGNDEEDEEPPESDRMEMMG